MKEANVYFKGYTTQEIRNAVRALMKKLQEEKEKQLKNQEKIDNKENAQ